MHGQRTVVLLVANFRQDLPGSWVREVRDGNFQTNPWDGTPSQEAEFALWEDVTIHGSP